MKDTSLLNEKGTHIVSVTYGPHWKINQLVNLKSRKILLGAHMGKQRWAHYGILPPSFSSYGVHIHAGWSFED